MRAMESLRGGNREPASLERWFQDKIHPGQKMKVKCLSTKCQERAGGKVRLSSIPRHSKPPGFNELWVQSNEPRVCEAAAKPASEKEVSEAATTGRSHCGQALKPRHVAPMGVGLQDDEGPEARTCEGPLFSRAFGSLSAWAISGFSGVVA